MQIAETIAQWNCEEQERVDTQCASWLDVLLAHLVNCMICRPLISSSIDCADKEGDIVFIEGMGLRYLGKTGLRE